MTTHHDAKHGATIAFELPAWLDAMAETYRPTLCVETQMALVVNASRRNVETESGGPFAAGIFETDTGALVALGVNLVTSERLSVLHAEMVALMAAQRRIGDYDLGKPGLAAHTLVTTTEPCAMCLGAIPWSGVRRVITGATEADARSVGFDEGSKPNDWKRSLETRGMTVLTEVLRSEAAAVLKQYRAAGGRIYNAHGG